MPPPRRRLSVARLEDRLTPAGWLDPAWGAGGVAAVPGHNSQLAAAGFPDGSVVVAGGGRLEYGSVDDTPSSVSVAPAVVTRLTPAGRPDPAFGVNGTVELADGFFQVTAVAAGPAGTVYVLGDRQSQAHLYRLLPDGSPDPGFDGDGLTTITPRLPILSDQNELAVKAGGGLVVSSGYMPRLAHVTPDGELDPAAGGDTTVPGASVYSPIYRLLPAADGGLYAVLHDGVGDGRRATVVTKLTAAGELDAAYGTGGRVILAAPLVNFGVEPGPGGGLLVVVKTAELPAPDPLGMPRVYFEEPVGLARLDAAGRFDPTFAGDGVAELGRPGGAEVTTVPLADGRTVVLTAALHARVLRADGTPDPAVAGGGWLALPAADFDVNGFLGPAVAVGPDRVALVGDRADGSGRVVVLDLSADTPAGAVIPVGDPAAVPLPAVLAEFPPPVPRVAEPVPVAPPVWVEPVEELPPAVPPQPIDLGKVMPASAPLPRVAGDFDGDGTADRVVTDGPTVSVVSGKDGRELLPRFAPLEASYAGPLNAVLADLTGDGRAELAVSPDQGGGPVVAVYAAAGELARFWGIEDAGFRGGVRLAAGDLNGDGAADLVAAAGDGGGPRVAVFDGRTVAGGVRRLVNDFFAFEEGQRGGAMVSVADSTLVFGTGPGGGPRVRAVDARSLLAAAPRSLDDLPLTEDRFVGDPAGRRGVQLSVRPGDGGRVEVVADAGAGRPTVVRTAPAADPLLLGAPVG